MNHCLHSKYSLLRFILNVYLPQADVAKVVETQTSLERQLELIETHQKEVGGGVNFFLSAHIAIT